jgi:hypothetical protein
VDRRKQTLIDQGWSPEVAEQIVLEVIRKAQN